MDSRDMTGAVWRKSSASNGQAECVEIAFTKRAVGVRDSKHPVEGMLAFSPSEWRAFIRKC